MLKTARRPRKSGRQAQIALAGIATAAPSFCWPQTEIADRMATLWQLEGVKADRWRRIVEGSGVELRHAVVECDEAMFLTTAQRMEMFEVHAGELAHSAADIAMTNAEVSPRSITDLIVVTCTGFASPGVDVALVDRLGLQPTVRRTQVGFMGCFGAVTGLRAAMGAVAAGGGVALLVCVELCSLHLRRTTDAENMVASALFADGAAAAVLSRSGGGAIVGRLGIGESLLLPEGRDDMSWRITDEGFAMTLSRRVPQRIRGHLGACLGRGQGSVVLHPGGPQVIDAAEEVLAGARRVDPAAREILRRFGNMSSPTVLFVLEEAMRNGMTLPATLAAFGPGLSIETIELS